MVEFRKMAQFMHDDVVLQMWRQEQELIAEVEILKRRAAPPACLSIAYADPII